MRIRVRCSIGAMAALWWMVCAGQVWAGQSVEGGLDSGDIAWILASSALVMGMIIPGLAFYYGGLVRSKNVISTMVQSFAILWCRQSGLGPVRLYAGLRAGSRRCDWRVGLGITHRCGCCPSPRVCSCRSARGLHAIPIALCRLYTGLGGRRLCRADQVRRDAVVRRSLVASCLCTARSLALGKRLAGTDRRAGFCRRRGGPYQCRRKRLGLCHGRGEATGLANGLHGATQSAVYFIGSGITVAWLVWI